MDFVVGLPRTERGFVGVMVVVDRLSKMVRFIPYAKANKEGVPQAAETARLFMDTVFRSHGMPRVITTDRDPQFTSAFWRSLWGLLDTKLAMSTAFHPETDGQSERVIRTLKQMLRAFVNDAQDNWDELLAPLEFAHNCSWHDSTHEVPFVTVYGRMPPTPAILWSKRKLQGDQPMAVALAERMRQALVRAKEQLATAQARQAREKNKHRSAHEFKVGDRVLLTTEHLRKYPGAGPKKKLSPVAVGPYTVTAVYGKKAVRLDLPRQLQGIHPVVNIERLRLYHDGEDKFPGRMRYIQPGPVTEIEGAPAFDVGAFLDRKLRAVSTRVSRGRRTPVKRMQVLVRWEGYGPEWDIWCDEHWLKQDLKESFDVYLEAMPNPPDLG